MAITTYKERQLRRRRAAELLAGGLSPADAASRLTAEWGCSRRTSLRDVNLGQDALLESIDSQTHAQLAAWCVASYARLMNKAEKAHQYGAAIGALNGLVRLVVEPQMQIANKRTFNGSRRTGNCK